MFSALLNYNKNEVLFNIFDFKKVTDAFVSSCLDFCTALCPGLSRKTIACLQLIKNAAACLLMSSKRQDYVTPLLTSLHWLPVGIKELSKIFRLTFKALNSQAIGFIAEMLILCMNHSAAWDSQVVSPVCSNDLPDY